MSTSPRRSLQAPAFVPWPLGAGVWEHQFRPGAGFTVGLPPAPGEGPLSAAPEFKLGMARQAGRAPRWL